MKNLSIGVVLATFLVGCANTPPATPSKPKPQIALVLGGGGAKGYAHIGVLSALEKQGIKPDLIVGSSAGAIVGAIYASGKTAQELKQLALTTNDADLLDPTPSKQGLFEGQKLRAFINTHTHHQPMERFPISFVAVATEVGTGTLSTFNTGEAGLAVQASASVPKLFIAPRIPEKYGKKYSDGGQVALVPASVAKQLGAKVVISVNVLSDPASPTPSINITTDDNHVGINMGNRTLTIPVNLHQLKGKTLPFGVAVDDLLSALPKQIDLTKHDKLWQTLTTGSSTISQADIDASDIMITPSLANFTLIDTTQKQAIIQAGEEATLVQMDTLKRKIATAISTTSVTK